MEETVALCALEASVGLLRSFQRAPCGKGSASRIVLGGVYIETREYRISIYWCDDEQGRYGTHGEELPRPLRPRPARRQPKTRLCDHEIIEDNDRFHNLGRDSAFATPLAFSAETGHSYRGFYK